MLNTVLFFLHGGDCHSVQGTNVCGHLCPYTQRYFMVGARPFSSSYTTIITITIWYFHVNDMLDNTAQ